MTYKQNLGLSVLAATVLILGACTSTPESTTSSQPLPDERLGGETTPEPDTQDQNSAASILPAELYLCPLTSVSNAPRPTDGLKITRYQPFATVQGVAVAVAPVEKGCLSSGFGPRSGKTHKGIDLHNARAVNVYAGASGVVREKQYRADYGNMIVLDHGDGVFTRYAHLESFNGTVEIGGSVSAGQTIGVMGNTAGYRIPRHLHYEVLTGTWGARAGSFALTPIDVFAAMSGN